MQLYIAIRTKNVQQHLEILLYLRDSQELGMELDASFSEKAVILLFSWANPAPIEINGISSHQWDFSNGIFIQTQEMRSFESIGKAEFLKMMFDTVISSCILVSQ